MNRVTPAAAAASMSGFWLPIARVARQETTTSTLGWDSWSAVVREAAEVKSTSLMVRFGCGFSFEEVPPIRERAVTV